MESPQFAPTPTVDASADIWGTELHPAGCETCDEAYLVKQDRIGQPCPDCPASTLSAQSVRLWPEPPERLLPFKLSNTEIANRLETFTKEVRFRLDEFNPQTLLGRLTPIFWPMWLVDSDMVGIWQGEMGYDYEVKSSRESYAGGGWHTEEVIETRIRWEPRAGQLVRHYDNITVPALSEHDQLTKLVGRYKIVEAQRYTVDQLGDALLRLPNMRPEHAWPLAQPRFDKSAGVECRRAAEAQHIRDFSIEAHYDALNWTQLLLPMYVAWYSDDDGKRHPIYINGQTGQVGGIRLASQRKGRTWAAGLSVAALGMFVLGLILTIAAALFPLTAVLGVPLMLIAFAVAIAALYPIIQPWQWNKTQREQFGVSDG